MAGVCGLEGLRKIGEVNGEGVKSVRAGLLCRHRGTLVIDATADLASPTVRLM